ncbi:MAG: hypothetical protein ACKN94_00235, partial [Pirellulaceae bacterium]
MCDWVPICASFASIDGGGALAATRPNTKAQGIALGSKGKAESSHHPINSLMGVESLTRWTGR